MNLKKIAKRGGFGLVGKLATGNVRGAFPVIARSIDAFNESTSFNGQVNDDVKKRPKSFLDRRFYS